MDSNMDTMCDVEYDTFLEVGIMLANNEMSDYDHIVNIECTSKTYEEYKKQYITKLELIIANNKKDLHLLDEEICELEKKNMELINTFSKKGLNGNAMNFLYRDQNIIKYFLSLKTLNSEKFKYNILTLQKLQEQKNIITDILNRNMVLLMNVS